MLEGGHGESTLLKTHNTFRKIEWDCCIAPRITAYNRGKKTSQTKRPE